MAIYKAELDIDHGMEYSAMGDIDFYLETLDIYLEETEAISADMQKFLDADDIPNYTILVHGLKSNSRTIGALALGDFAERMEMKGKEGDGAYIRENQDALMAHLAKVQAEVRDFLAEQA